MNLKTIVIIKKIKETIKRDCGIRGMKHHHAMGLLMMKLANWQRDYLCPIWGLQDVVYNTSKKTCIS